MVETIGRYEIVRELGRGGMAIVYLAHDPSMEREVAIKVLPRQFTFDPNFRQRFRREARLVARLQHPAIVPVYDFGEEDDQLYLVMAFMRGGSLHDRLQRGPLPLAECARILNDLAPGLDVAHQRGMIHRDLKPANILFDEWGKPYLADFGITKLIASSDTALTATGGLVGTPAYMSPEQALATKELDGRSDLYALGVILFEMITGRVPFAADTPIGLALKHISEPIPQVAQENPALPPTVQGVINTAMAKEREARYPTAVTLAAAVSGLAAAGPDAATLPLMPPPVPAATPPPVAAAVAAAAVAAVPAAAAAAPPPTPPPPAAAGGGLSASSWWPVAGAIGGVVLVVALLFLALRGRVGVNEVAATLPATGAAAALAATASHTPAPSRTPTLAPSKTATPSRTPAPSRTPTRTPTATPTWDPALPPPIAELGDTWERLTDGMVLVYVPAGSFLMGSAAGDADADSDEFPQHRVSLDAFWLDQTEVSNAQFADFVADTDYVTTAEEEGSGRVYLSGSWTDVAGADWQHPQGPSSSLRGLEAHPVVQVSWDDADAYCAWAGGQLPTEAQWEYAARGPEGLKYPWGNSFDGELVNFCDANCSFDWRDADYDDGYEFTAPVGSYPAGASWVGALDMAGNVWEWVADWYDADYYDNSPAANPAGPATGEYKVLRGGYWGSGARNVRGANRDYNSASTRNNIGLGFRCLVPQG